MMCLLYCWVLLQQVLGILRAEDAPLVYNRFFELSRLDCLWMFWILKECFFISVPRQSHPCILLDARINAGNALQLNSG
jgi:hypothetical protein